MVADVHSPISLKSEVGKPRQRRIYMRFMEVQTRVP